MQGKGDGRAAKFALENGWNGEPTPTNEGPVGRERLMHETTQEMKRLGWSEVQGRNYLKQQFAGKETRSKLTNNELSQFLAYLKNQTTPIQPKAAPIKPHQTAPNQTKPTAPNQPNQTTSTQPKPAQGPPPVSAEVSANLAWLRSLTTALGQPVGRSDTWIKQAMQEEFEGKKTLAELDVFQLNRIVRKVLVYYALPSYPDTAETLCYKNITNNEAMGDLEPHELAQAWLKILRVAVTENE